MFAFAGGPLLQGVIDLVTNPTRLLDGFPHGKNQTRNGHLRPLREVKTMDRMVPDPVTATGLAEIGVAFAGMNQHDGHLGLMAIPLPDHFGGGAKLAGCAVDGGSGTKTA